MKKAIGIVVVLLLIIGIIYFNSYSIVRTFDIDGYLFTSEHITDNLINGEDIVNEKVDFSKVKYDDNLYLGRGKYYIGDKDKINVNIDYPLVSANSDTLLILSNSGKLIDNFYRKTNTYTNSFISDNKLYNESDYERADNINYMFLELKSSIFVNLYKLSIFKGDKEYIIPINSFISFYDNGLRYYYFSKDKYVYKEIKGLDKDAEILINENRISYITFLEKLGLFMVDEDNSSDLVSDDDFLDFSDNSNNKIDDNSNNSQEYVKPIVKFDGAKTSTYSFSGKLNIYDPTSQIVKYPTFEFWDGNTLYIRKTFVNDGIINLNGLYPDREYRVVASYNYKNENGQEVKSKLDEFTIKTKDMSELEDISFDISNIIPHSNNVELNGLKIVNDSSDEVLKGIKKIIVNVGKNNFQLNNSMVSKLLKNEPQDFISSKSLSSNTEYDVLFEVYDVAGNKLNVLSRDYKFKTSKQVPFGNISLKSKDITKVTIAFKMENPDNVNISNMYYELYDSKKNLVKSDTLNGYEVTFEKLDANELYYISVFGSYDLEDGNGIIKNQELIDGKFTTESISVLGYVRLNFSNIVSTSSSIKYDIKISDDMNPKLKELISGIVFDVKDSVDNTVVTSVSLSDEELNRLLNGGYVTIENENLDSNRSYYFDFHSYVMLGSKRYDIKTMCNISDVKTYKKEAEVNVINKFITQSIIDFDVMVDDVDGAIDSGRVLLEVRDSLGSLVYYDELMINDNYKHIYLDKLRKDEYYYFRYIVEEYNVGYNYSTVEANYLLFEDKIYTEEGLFGSVEIESLLKQPTTKNLFDLNNNVRWKTGGAADVSRRKSNLDDDTLSLGAKNGYRTYSYYLPEYKNKYVTVSFKIKYLDNNNGPVYLCNNGSNNCGTYRISGVNKDGWISYSKTFIVNNGSPYVSFTIVEDANKNNITTVVIKDLQIEAGNTASEYHRYGEKDNYIGKFIINLTDRNHEIDKDMFYYYLRFYENGVLSDTVQFDFNDQYSVIDQIYSHEIVPYKDLDVRLSVKMKIASTSVDDSTVESGGWRFYDLASVIFSSDEEIRTIHNYDDLIAIHTSGKYLVADDIDFRDRTSNVSIAFNGTIDFQGHRVDMDSHYLKNNVLTATTTCIFSTINRNGVIKNIDFHYHFDGPARTNIYGIVSGNSGLIENVKVTVYREYEYPSDQEEKGNYNVSFISNTNYGKIRNFAIKLENTILIERRCGLVTYNNYGDIFNGYLYGEAIDAHFNHLTKESRYIGGVAAYANNYSNIQNVFSLIDINIGDGQTTKAYHCEVGNILGASTKSILRNIYTYSDGANRRHDVDVNVYSGTMNRLNVFYVSPNAYKGTYSNRIATNALRSVSFQEMLNEDNAFIVEDLVRFGYYPQLKWPQVMPKQDYIVLPNESSEQVDFLDLSDKVENSDGTVEANLEFANPGYDTITELVFSSGLQCQILDQNDNDNKSILHVVFSNPTVYTSNYSLTKIVSLSSFNTTNTRIYDASERKIYVDMYKNIYNMNQFLDISKGIYQNYRLQTDLDFENIDLTAKSFATSFYGKLDGNNHTISNITVNNRNFINTLANNSAMNYTPTIKNLFVENYKQTGNNARGGFIGELGNVSTIDNVHLKDVIITDSNTYIGGLAGVVTNSLISNSSVTNIKIYETSNVDLTKTNKRFGGFVGQSTTTIINNCFVQNVDIDINTSLPTLGIGGFVGRQVSGYIQDGYVTGKINSNQQEIGGVVGYNSSYIERFISMVDIHTYKDSLGGIAGYSTTDAITNTLVLGSIYTVKDAVNLNRTIGNRTSLYSNYAWSDQLLNGLNTSLISGDILVSYEDLRSYATYAFLGNSFDLSSLVDEENHNILPKLKYSSSDKLLPNQNNNDYYVDSFNIKDVSFDKGASNATIQIIFNNPNNYEIQDVSFDGLRVIRVNNNFTVDGETVYEVYVAPERYYDSYMIDNVNYVKNSKVVNINPVVRVDMSFYKDIATYEDWQSISTKYYENYRLVSDIDFTDKPNIKTNLLINRLDGTDGGHTLSNITINDSSNCLINTLTGSISNVNFENINITSTNKELYVGIIKYLNGTMKDVNFKNITIDSLSDYTGCIAYNSSIDVRNINITGYINIKGKAYVGALAGYSRFFDMSDISLMASDSNSNVKSTVKGTGNYVGGLIGYEEYTATAVKYRFTVDNIDVVGTSSYVGGVFGYGSCNVVNVTRVNVQGGSYVGGVAGQRVTISNVYYRGTESERLTVKGTGSYVGGAFGYGGSGNYIRVYYADVSGGSYIGGVSGNGGVTYARAYNLSVKGTNYIGGICGNGSNNYAIVTKTTIKGTSYVGGSSGQGGTSNSGIDSESTVTGTGSYVGGLVGLSNNGTIASSYVYKTHVTGNYYVGGIAGYNTGSGTNQMYYNISSAVVTANSNYAGGFYGGIANSNEQSNELYYRVFLYRNILAGSSITSNGTRAGAITGTMNLPPYVNRFYQNLVHANVTTNQSSTTVDDLYKFLIGCDDVDYNYASMITEMGIYEGSSYNEIYLTELDDKLTEIKNSDSYPSGVSNSLQRFINNVSFYDISSMNSSSTFSNFLLSGTTFDGSRISSGYYPFLKNSVYYGSGIVYFKLPTGVDGASPKRLNNTSLPDVKTYVSDVDKINLEFSYIDDNIYFTVGNNTYGLNKLSYTFNYDFSEDFVITIYNSDSSKTIKIEADQLRSSVSVDGNNYYFLNGEKIITNNNDSLSNLNNSSTNTNFRRILKDNDNIDNKDSNKYMNIYNNKILLSNKNIYDISKKVTIENSFDNLSLVNDVALYEFKYGNNIIDTYYNYSVINGDVISKQVFVKNDSIEVIDSTLNNKKDNILVNNYNGNNYLIYLGVDGKLYSLKDNIKFPNKFINNNIKSITTDMYNDSNIIFVLYNNNDYIVFNYLTGKVLSKSTANSDLVSYFKSYIGNKNIINRNMNNYNESLELISKLNDKNINEVLGKNNDSKVISSNNYISVYNPVTEKYDVYNISDIYDNNDILLNDVLTTESTNNEITNNLVLFDYYIGTERRMRTILISVLSIIILIFSGIGISVFLLKRNLKNN